MMLPPDLREGILIILEQKRELMKKEAAYLEAATAREKQDLILSRAQLKNEMNLWSNAEIEEFNRGE